MGERGVDRQRAREFQKGGRRRSFLAAETGADAVHQFGSFRFQARPKAAADAAVLSANARLCKSTAQTKSGSI
jgi:hypothetical protein